MVKKIGLGIIALLCGVQTQANSISIKSSIKAVTVYPVGAMVTREAKFTMNKPNHELRLEGLTYAVDPNTIQVSGIGNYEIVSVKFENVYPYAKNKPKGIQAVEDSISANNNLIFMLDAQERALNDEYQLIKENSTHANTAMTIQELNAMANYYRDRMAEIAKKKLETQNSMVKAHAEKSRLQSVLAGMNNYKYEQEGVIVVEVFGAVNTSGKIQFSYFTHLASWFPSYKVKAKELEKEVEFNLNAYVSQTTGVDWSNVTLKLSTSRPTFNNQQPALHPWFLDFVVPSRAVVASGSYGDFKDLPEQMEERKQENTIFENGQLKAKSVATSAGFVKGQEIMNGLNVAYEIEKPYTIVSNPTRKLVYIKTTTVPATFAHYAAPRMEKSAYMTAHISNFSSYDLIPGTATLFYNNTYVGKSYVNSLITEDSLALSLGINQNIMVDYNKVQDLCDHKKIGANIKRNYVYDLTIKNGQNEAIDINIYELIPISKRSDINVTIIDLSAGILESETGIVEWKKTIPANQKMVIRVSYSVKYPKGKYINI